MDNSQVTNDKLAEVLAQPDMLEENDLFKLLLVNRDLDLYDAQMTILKMRIAEAQRTMAALNQQMKDKYGLTDSDTINSATGMIVRNGKAQHDNT